MGLHGELDGIGDEIDDDLKKSTRVKNHPVNVEISNTGMWNKFEIDVLGLDFRTEPKSRMLVLISCTQAQVDQHCHRSLDDYNWLCGYWRDAEKI